MSDPVNLANLRDITGGDADLERELFAVFHTSAQEAIAAMQGALEPAATAEWQRQAHAMKGISYNLGAGRLGDLCQSAQHEPGDTVEARRTLLNAIMAELARVRDFMKLC